MVDFGGWISVDYSGLIAEHMACALPSASSTSPHMERSSTGPSLASVQHLCMNDASSCPSPGAVLCNAHPDGAFVDDVLVQQAHDNDYLIVINRRHAPRKMSPGCGSQIPYAGSALSATTPTATRSSRFRPEGEQRWPGITAPDSAQSGILVHLGSWNLERRSDCATVLIAAHRYTGGRIEIKSLRRSPHERSGMRSSRRRGLRHSFLRMAAQHLRLESAMALKWPRDLRLHQRLEAGLGRLCQA